MRWVLADCRALTTEDVLSADRSASTRTLRFGLIPRRAMNRLSLARLVAGSATLETNSGRVRLHPTPTDGGHRRGAAGSGGAMRGAHAANAGRRHAADRIKWLGTAPQKGSNGSS
jgi:hypothetical protein